MNMDVLVDETLRHSFTKRAAGPLALLPLAGKALGAVGSAALPAAKFTGSMIGQAAAMEGVNRAANKVLGPQGGQGPGGTGAGLEPGVGGPRGGSTHGMIGFPPQGGPKGGYGPPNFGRTHSRDRADPDFENEGARERNPVAGFKLASAVLAEMGLVKLALDTPGMHMADAAMNWGDARDLGGAALQSGGAAAMDLGRAGAAKMRDIGQVGLAKGKELGQVGLAKGKALGQRAWGAVQPQLARAGGAMKAAPGAAMGAVRAHPYAALGTAAAIPAMYLGYRALMGGDKKKEEDPKMAAALLSNNLLDVLAVSMELAEKEAGLTARPFC